MATISALIPQFLSRPQPKQQAEPPAIEMQSFSHCSAEDDGQYEQADVALARLRAARLRAKLLASSSAAATPAPPAILPKAQLSALLVAIEKGLHLELSDVVVKLMFAGVMTTLEQTAGKELSLKDWAMLSLQLDALCARLKMLPLPIQERIAPSHFVRLNLNNLAKVVSYLWVYQAREALVAVYAAEQAQQTVSNPALVASRSSTVSAGISTPLPFLKAGLELNLQQLTSIDEDGNFVTTSLAGCTGSVKASAAVISGKAKLGGTVGCCFYTKNWQEYARFKFDELFAQHRDRPELAIYLSRTACLGGPAPAPENDEIAQFDQLQAQYNLQQRSNSRLFSLLVSSQSAPLSAPTVCPTSEPLIKLQATPSAIIKPAKGVVTTLGGAASGSLGIDLSVATLGMSAEVSGQTKTTRYRSVDTLCELLKSEVVDHAFKATMIRKLANISSRLRTRLDQFWGQREPLTAAQKADRLCADVGHYFRLHAWQQAGHTNVAASIKAFNAAYGANDGDQCLRNMAWMVAFLYAELMQHNASPETTRCLKQLLLIETELHHPSIAHTKGYLAQRAAVSQKIKYTSNEVVVQFSVGVDGTWVPVNPNGSVKFTYCRQEKTSALVEGDKVQVEVILGADPALNARLMTSVNDYFHQHLGIPMSADMMDFFTRSGHTGQVCTSWQFLKATAISADLPFVQLFERETMQQTTQAGGSLPLPIPGLGNVTLAASQATTHKKLLRETPGCGTVLYYARHFMHARSSAKMDEQGRFAEDCYWKELEQKHRAALSKLFLHYALDHRNQGYLMRELAAIRHKFFIDANEEQCTAWDTAQQEFLTMVDQFAIDPCSDNYRATLQGFKNLLQVWYPLWKRDKDRDSRMKYRSRRTHLA